MFRKGTDGKRRLYAANLVLALVIVAVITLAWSGLLEDAYRRYGPRILYCH